MSRVDRSLVRLFSLLAPNLALLVSLGQLISFNESWSVHGCEVKVSSPWEEATFIPQDSNSISVSCSKQNEEGQNMLEWSIRLPDRQVDDSFAAGIREEILNNRGFYKLRSLRNGTLRVIRLAINNTERINGTMLKCVDIISGNLIEDTTIIVYEPKETLTMIVSTNDIGEQSINLTWSFLRQPGLIDEETTLTYVLKVVPSTSDASPLFLNVQDSFYEFSAPRDAPPCEVYNFSVTATYVGATYTGDGCSVPSPVISRMLPSLPDIRQLNSSLKFSLEKQISGGVMLTVSLRPAQYCDSYPVMEYHLLITSDSELIESVSQVMKLKHNILRIKNLLEDQTYTFSIVALNSVGSVPTNGTKIYTTDVQSVTIAPHTTDTSSNIALLECTFIAGSDARGCMVVLLGKFDNITTNLTKEDSHSSTIIQVVDSLSCYGELIGFDIESDGSVGTVAVPGVILLNISMMTTCIRKLSPAPSFSPWIIGVIIGVMVIAITLLTFITTMVCCRNIKRSRSRDITLKNYLQVSKPPDLARLESRPSIASPTFSDHDSEALGDSKQCVDMQLYAIPKKVTFKPKEQLKDAIAHDATTHDDVLSFQHKFTGQQNPSGKSTMQQDNEEHVYHVLETPQDQLEVSFMSPDIIPIRQSASFSEATTPIYQDISEVSSSKTYIQKSESNVDQDSRGWRSQTIPLYQVIPAAESELDENVVTSCDENDRTVYQQISSSGTNVL